MLKHLQVGGLGLGNPTKIPLIKIKTAYDSDSEVQLPSHKNVSCRTPLGWPRNFWIDDENIFPFWGDMGVNPKIGGFPSKMDGL